MALEKRIPYRNQKLKDIAKDMPCMNCSVNNGTTVLCHYSGLRAYQFGKGKAQKVDDDCAAFLCGKCHKEFDNYQAEEGDVANSELFLFCVVRTMNLLHRIGFQF